MDIQYQADLIQSALKVAHYQELSTLQYKRMSLMTSSILFYYMWRQSLHLHIYRLFLPKTLSL